MSIAQRVLLFVVALAYAISAFPVDLTRYKTLPMQSAATTWQQPSASLAGELDELDEGLSPSRIREVFSGLKPEVSLTTRGSKDASLYARLAPSVVLVVTDQGVGSGIVIATDGTILTSWHVIADADWAGVVLKPKQDGAKITKKDIRYAKILKVDQVADLALIKLVALPPSLKPVAFAKAADIQIGSDVHAIGHPNDQAWTYTKGVISQVRKDHAWHTDDGLDHKADLIQTQTPINPGNSGGPLFSDDGKLIGINTLKAEGEGLNFAVSIVEINRFLARKGDREAEVAKRSGCEIHTEKTRREVYDNALGDMARIDTNCDGQPDAFLFEPVDKEIPIVFVLQRNENEIVMIVADQDRDGKWDVSLHYEAGNPTPVAVGHHPDGKLKPSSYEPYTEDSEEVSH
jgi:S1-C subfamily serine protease